MVQEKDSQLELKDEEMESLRAAFHAESKKAAKLSNELNKSLVMQRTKDDEIQLLNVAAKQDNNGEYCIVTADSMESFKLHIHKTREENRSLMLQIDEVECTLEARDREMHTMAITHENLVKKGKMLQEV